MFVIPQVEKTVENPIDNCPKNARGRTIDEPRMGLEIALTEHYFIFHQLHFDSRFKKDISSFNILE